MTTIDRLSLGIADVPAARTFYGQVLDILSIRCLAEEDGFAACITISCRTVSAQPETHRSREPTEDVGPGHRLQWN